LQVNNIYLGDILVKERLGILASGRGSNFQAIMEHIDFDILKDVEAEVLISDNPDARALEVADRFEISKKAIPPKNSDGRKSFEKKIHNVLKENNVSLVILAGFMRIISPYLVGKYKNRIMNIHPSLLPSFPGLGAQKKALEYGVKVSGCTIHYTTEEIDSGPIILQKPVPIEEGDEEKDLSKRTLIFEHRLYSKAIQLHVDERLSIENGRVIIDYSDNWKKDWNKRQKRFIEHQRKSWKKEIFKEAQKYAH